jgi:hypothetical protein
MNKQTLAAAVLITIVGSSVGSRILSGSTVGSGAINAVVGGIIDVSNWRHEPAEYSKSCQVSGTIKYEITTDRNITGPVSGYGKLKDGDLQWSTGMVIDGKGFITFHMSEFSERACPLKASSDINIVSWELSVTPGYVLTIDKKDR